MSGAGAARVGSFESFETQMSDRVDYELVVDVLEGRYFPQVQTGRGVVAQVTLNDEVGGALGLHAGAGRSEGVALRR